MTVSMIDSGVLPSRPAAAAAAAILVREVRERREEWLVEEREMVRRLLISPATRFSRSSGVYV